MTDPDPLPPPAPTFSPDSIFDCIKKLLGVDVEDTSFDMDIVLHINSALMAVNQLGVGPVGGFTISDNTSKWSDLLGSSIQVEAVKVYIFLKVKLIFDPPTSSTVLDAMSRAITEFEARLNIQVEPMPVTVVEGDDDDDY